MLDQIDIKFANKVILEVGLCISLFDFQEIGDPYVYPAEGSAHQRVKFRMIVFRPFAGEVHLIRDSIYCSNRQIVTIDCFPADIGGTCLFLKQRWDTSVVRLL